MACYHPNKMFVVGDLPNGKKNLIYTAGTNCEAVCNDYDPRSKRWSKWYNSDWQEVIDWSNTHKWNDHLWLENRPSPLPSRWWSFEYIEVPCGQCSGCRVDRSRQWADRMLIESREHDANCFITLTYDNDHVPRSSYQSNRGEYLDSLTLRKRDMQLFLKRLRRRLEPLQIRFFGCGEYGGRTHRPHYHLIIFGWFPDDAVEFNRSPNGDVFYTSETISKAWQNQGHILVSNVSWDTCAYTARYVTKKLNGDGAGLYHYKKIEPPFSLMSRRPGIARKFYDEHKDDIYNLDKLPNIYISTPEGGRKIKPPRYYDKLYDIEYPEESAQIKEIRKKLATGILQRQLKQTDLDKWQQLEVDERYFNAKIKILNRDRIKEVIL